ncbi:MAG: hypothetical protein JWR83_2996 [Aeromicrobium sp.]|nr:hypothetical protein [Aeromicrobium sp.]
MSDQPQYPSYPGPEQPVTPTPDPSHPGYQPPPPPEFQPAAPPSYQPPAGQVPPPGYGQEPPGYVPASWGQPSEPVSQYVHWGIRVGGFLLDRVIYAVVGFMVGFMFGIALYASCSGTVNDQLRCSDNPNGTLGDWLVVAVYVVPFFVVIANEMVLQGLKGQSLGKMVVGSKVVRISTGQPMGFWLAVGRWLLLVLLTGVTCTLNLLWPLWDAKNQTLHDKVAGTVVVRSR